MRYCATVPGVVYADRVLLKAPWLRERYLDKLCAWAGEESRAYWEKKLEILPETLIQRTENDGARNMVCEMEEQSQGKRILYVIGLDGAVLQGEAFIKALGKKLESLQSDPEVARVELTFYPPSMEEWEHSAPGFIENIRKQVKVVPGDKCVGFMSDESVESKAYDAYYGSASPAALAFRLAGKEVILQG